MSNKNKRVLSLDGIKVPYPCGIQCKINEKTGFGEMIMQYVGDPDDCYNAFKNIKKNYGNNSFLSTEVT